MTTRTTIAPLVTPLAGAPAPEVALGCVADLPLPLLLDSGAATHAGRYSFLMADPWAIVRADGATARVRRAGAAGWEPAEGDALAAVASLLAPHAADPIAGLPPFQGGAAGYLGYELGRAFERVPLPRHDDLRLPDAVLGLYDWVVAWDHATGGAWLVSTGMPAHGDDAARRAGARAREVLARLRAPADRPPPAVACPPAVESPPTYPVLGIDGAEELGLRSTFSRRGYLNAVQRVRDYIVAGDIFQANLSQRFEAAVATPPLALYRRLRARNPAPFAAYLDLGDAQVLSASPERFLRVDGGAVETRPIKGTRPRGLGPMHDAMLGRLLVESEKDRAENVMIVDLLRNDLSRVCRPGSVRVPALFALEQHPTVHHLVSTVVGTLRPGHDATDLLRAAFPGGSITGAPKVRAMEIIAELEPTRRGVYCGSLGWLDRGGGMDTSVAIRTLVLRRGRVTFPAGGGIVADSDPEAEYDETLHKARGLIEALRP